MVLCHLNPVSISFVTRNNTAEGRYEAASALMTAEGGTVVWAQPGRRRRKMSNQGVGGGLEKPRRECKAEYRPTLADRSH